MNTLKKRAFTLVELIVVITILAILATIGFVSFSGYLAGTRDTNRVAQIKAMSDALELYTTKKSLPIPDDKIDIVTSSKTIAYQGYIGKNVLETIEYTESGLDPKDKNYFSYYLTKNKKYFQLLAFLEEENTDTVAVNVSNNSQATDYSERFPKVTGKKLGILVGSGSDFNTPVQDLVTGSLNIETTANVYSAIFDDNSKISGNSTILSSLENVAIGGGIASSCKTLLDRRASLKGKDGIYIIAPGGVDPFTVNCDMSTDGGGWTLYSAKNKHGFSNTGFMTINDILNNNIDYEYIRWNYVSPNGKKLPLIYKLAIQKEGKLLLGDYYGILDTVWQDSNLHYTSISDFKNAFSIGDLNTSGVTTSQFRNATQNDGNRYLNAWVNGTGKNSIFLGTTGFYSATNMRSNYLRFPSSPYNGTYRIGTETFSHISNTQPWNDGRSISIWIK